MDSEEKIYDDFDCDESIGDGIEFSREVEDTLHIEKQTDSEDFQYEVLSTEEIIPHMEDSIKDVTSVVDIPATTAHVLLNHFQWDKQKFMERFYDGNHEKLFYEASIINSFKDLYISLKPQEKAEVCDICLKNFPTSNMIGLVCSHQFCTDCWCGYLTTKILKDGVGQTITCASQGCDILVDDATVMRLVKDSKVKLKYQYLITNSFVKCNPLFRWCPSPNCSNAIKIHCAGPHKITCKCGRTFCFSCSENWHAPVKCHLLKKWKQMLKQNTSIFTSIQKDNVPTYKIFRNENLGLQFCWVCRKPHNNGLPTCTCNKNPRDALILLAEQSCHRNLCSDMYKKHRTFLTLEHDLYASVQEKMEKMQQYMSWSKVQFLKKALDVLCECRQTLMYSYVFGYYLLKNNQSEIFENNQKDLQNATDTLSKYLKRDVTPENLADYNQKVLDTYTYCDNRRKVLLEHVSEGYEREWWDNEDNK